MKCDRLNFDAVDFCLGLGKQGKEPQRMLTYGGSQGRIVQQQPDSSVVSVRVGQWAALLFLSAVACMSGFVLLVLVVILAVMGSCKTTRKRRPPSVASRCLIKLISAPVGTGSLPTSASMPGIKAGNASARAATNISPAIPPIGSRWMRCTSPAMI